MLVFLDHQQRLNLIALMGPQRCNVAEMRMFGKLMDRFELDPEEKEAIQYKVVMQPNGLEGAQWNLERNLPVREYEITEREALRLRTIVEEWQNYVNAVDRRWVLNFLDQVPEAAPAPEPASMAVVR